jgi:hypothetical protein
MSKKFMISVCKENKNPGKLAHICIPSNSGGTEKEDHGSRIIQEKC